MFWPGGDPATSCKLQSFLNELRFRYCFLQEFCHRNFLVSYTKVHAEQAGGSVQQRMLTARFQVYAYTMLYNASHYVTVSVV